MLETVPNLELSVSVTTRTRRPTERDGIDYTFVDDVEFDRLIEVEELLEWAEVFGARYGTPAGPIRRALDAGRDALLEIDVQGARQVREAMPEAILIFLAAPSLAELERRLRSRGTEDEARLKHRMEKASDELEAASWFDERVVNDDLERASSQVAAMIEASRARSGAQPPRPDVRPYPEDPSTPEGTTHP